MTGKSPKDEHPVKTMGCAARDTSGILSPFKFSRRATGDKDIRFKVLYCGICHTNLHCTNDDWDSPPILSPGHEIVGTLRKMGNKVSKFKIGDKLGVGPFIGSCGSCQDCSNDLENYCPNHITTYPGTYHDGTPNYGGYSNEMVANEHFVVRIPNNMPLDSGAPLLCAGITVYSPLKYYGLTTPGTHVGVVGLGGLGHIGVKFAKVFGLKVTAISTSPSKKEEALKHLGADSFLVSSDLEQMQASVSTMDGIIDTVSAFHPIMPLIDLLKNHGKFIDHEQSHWRYQPFLYLWCFTACADCQLEEDTPVFGSGRKMVVTSSAGGMKETQEMMDFAAKQIITADIEVIRMDYVKTAMERLHKGDVKYRFVIDVGKSSLAAA